MKQKKTKVQKSTVKTAVVNLLSPITIPKNTWHYAKTTSKEPLKVISIQAPNFDGKDRIFK